MELGIIIAALGLVWAVGWAIFTYLKPRKEKQEKEPEPLKDRAGLRLIQDELASLAQPLFAEFGAKIGGDKTEVSFTNKGETAKNVFVKPGDDFSASISSDVIKSNERGLIKLSGSPLPEKLTFEIHYESKVGKTGVRKVYVSDSKVSVEGENYGTFIEPPKNMTGTQICFLIYLKMTSEGALTTTGIRFWLTC